MNDQIGGGFHRYSVDERWFVPHFEKMLYDQAQLAVSYLEAFQITRDGQYAAAARDIFTYLLRDMTDPGGGFYSAEDADSASDPAHPHEKGEGAFYIWRKQEIEEALGRAPPRCSAIAMASEDGGNVEEDPHGEFRGTNILYQAHTGGRRRGARGVAAGLGETAGDSRPQAAAAARRQGAGRLERPDDFGVRQRRADFERCPLRAGGARGGGFSAAAFVGRAAPDSAAPPSGRGIGHRRIPGRLRLLRAGFAGSVRGHVRSPGFRMGGASGRAGHRAVRRHGERRLFQHRPTMALCCA